MRVPLLVVLLAALAGRCSPDRTSDGWPGQRDAFERLCVRVGICFLVLLMTVFVAAPARAEAPQETRGNWRYGISAAVAVTAIDLRKGKVYSAGINAAPSLGACFGVTYLPLDLGVDGCGNYQANQDKPNQIFGSLMVHWKTWLNGGFGALFTQGEPWAPLLLFGGRLGVYEGGASEKVEAW